MKLAQIVTTLAFAQPLAAQSVVDAFPVQEPLEQRVEAVAEPNVLDEHQEAVKADSFYTKSIRTVVKDPKTETLYFFDQVSDTTVNIYIDYKLDGEPKAVKIPEEGITVMERYVEIHGKAKRDDKTKPWKISLFENEYDPKDPDHHRSISPLDALSGYKEAKTHPVFEERAKFEVFRVNYNAEDGSGSFHAKPEKLLVDKYLSEPDYGKK